MYLIMSKKKNESQVVNFFVFSVHHPNDTKEQTVFNNHLSSIYESHSSSYIVMYGQDLNDNEGI